MNSIISKCINWYFARAALPYWCIFIIDCLIVLFSSIFAHALSVGTVQTISQFGALLGTLIVYMFFYIIGFRLFHTYSGILRYSSFVDLQRIGFAMLIGAVLITAFRWIFHFDNFFVEIRVRELVFTFFLATSLMWTIRVVVKYLYDIFYASERAKRVFIYGVKHGGIGIAKSIHNQKPTKYVLKGFISDESDTENRMLMGVRVYPNNASLVAIMKNKGVSVLLVSPIKNESLRENDSMKNELMEAGIKIYMMSQAVEWNGEDEIHYSQLREVDIEDLLPRDEIDVDMEAVGEVLSKKRILITGSAGSIGSEMVRQISIYKPGTLILIDQAETPQHDIRLMMSKQWPDIESHVIVANICNQIRMDEIFREFCPDYVFHAAAYKHVPMMEDNPGESVHNNIYGTKIIADLSIKYAVKKFVMISTDKAVNPTNVMGCSKRICEIYVQSMSKAIREGKIDGITQFVTTRFGNVLGSNGSVIPLFKEQIKNGGPVTVTAPNIIRFFMLIPEACKLVLEAGTKGKGGEIFVFDMGKPVKIADLAKKMIQLSGAQDVRIVYTGLREGEKLYEEVLNKVEITKPTFHPKIKIAEVREYDYEDICCQLEELFKIGLSYGDNMEIVRLMKNIVPEYKSNNSRYEQLDKSILE